MMMPNSISKTLSSLKINEIEKIQCELKRHIAPRTVRMILTVLPLKSNVHIFEKAVSLQTPITCDIERPRKEFKRGDIAFLPKNGKIYFFRSDVMTEKPMTLIGKIVIGTDELDCINPEDKLLLDIENK